MENLPWQQQPLARQGASYLAWHSNHVLPLVAADDAGAVAAALLLADTWDGQSGVSVIATPSLVRARAGAGARYR